jgi:hypothetical protein
MFILLKRCNITPLKTAFALFILVFCSPLTIYGATYWEHMPAVFLLFFGIAFIVKPSSRLWTAIIQGVCCGLAVWLRPEALVLDILFALALLILYLKQKQAVYPFFLSGMFLAIAVFFAFNKIEYGSFFGIHGYQVLNEGGLLKKGIEILIGINTISIHYFPFILLLIPVFFRLAKSNSSLDLRSILLLFIIIAFCLLTPFVLPNEGGRQWGARYFLPIIPIIIILLFLIDKQWKLTENTMPSLWLIAIILICTGYSFYLNAYKGGIKKLRWENYNRIKPSIDFAKQNGDVVVIGAGYIAMEMADVFNEKYFFVADNDSSLNKLLPLLKKQGIHEFTYVYDVNGPKGLPDLLKNAAPPVPEKNDFSFLKYIIR